MKIDSAPALPRFMNLQEVKHQTTLGRSSIYAMPADFPRIKIGNRTVFLEADVVAFMNKRIEASKCQS